MSRYELFRCDDFYIYLNGAEPACERVVIAFDHWRNPHDEALGGFGEDFAVTHGMDVICVRCHENRWFQYEEMPAALDLVAEFVRDWKRVVTYGSSMGGYAALRYAGALGACRAVAVSPQYSIDPAKAPWEYRYPEEAEAIDFSHEGPMVPAPDCHYAVVYDPINPWDAQHVARIAQDIAVEAVKYPLSGHAAFEYLSEAGLASGIALGLIEGNYDHRHFRTLARQSRRGLARYWFHLTWMLEIYHHRYGSIQTSLIYASKQADKPAAYVKAVEHVVDLGHRSLVDLMHLVPAEDRALLLAAARAVPRARDLVLPSE